MTTTNKNLGLPLKAVLAQVLHGLFTNIPLCLNRAQIDKQYRRCHCYNTTGAHAAEVRGGTFRHALEAV